MMRKILLHFFLLINAGTASAQNISQLIDQIKDLRVSNPDSAILLSEKAFKLLEKKKNDFEYTRLYNCLGTAYLYKGEIESAKENYLKGIRYARKAENDTLEIFIFNNLGLMAQDYLTYEEAYGYYQAALKKGMETNIQREIADTYNNLGSLNMYFDYNDSAIHYFEMGISHYEKETERKYLAELGKADIKANIGRSYYTLGKYNLSYVNYFESLKIFEKHEAWAKAAIVSNNISELFIEKNEMKKAEKYVRSAMKFDQKEKRETSEALSYFILAKIFQSTERMDSALLYYHKSIDIYNELNLTYQLAVIYNSMGSFYDDRNEVPKAMQYFFKALELNIHHQDTTSIALNYFNIAFTYLKENDIPNAKSFNDKSRALLKPNMYYSLYIDVYGQSADIYSKIGQYKEAYDFIRIRNTYRDSLTEEVKLRQQEEIEAIYQNEKKDRELKLEKSLSEKKSLELEHAEKEKEVQAYQIQLMALGGFLLLIFVVIVFRSNMIRKRNNRILAEKNGLILQQKAEVVKQKDELSYKNLIIEEKQKEIIDSINYAKRLQQAILATKEEIDRFIPENFLLYKPKDIVAGDFYFFEVTDENIFYAAADCTGHGVPGALVSVVCANALSRSVKEFKLTDPGKILDKTRDQILETFMKSGQEVKDGMDISLLVIHRKTKELKWAGANNPLWFIQNGAMIEIKADKQPIGKSDNPQPFTTHSLPSTLTTLFLFTDGYADQFGGEKGKKFKYSNLEKLLLNISPLSFAEQRQKLIHYFEEWKGDLEQVDDVCIIGIRIGDNKFKAND